MRTTTVSYSELDAFRQCQFKHHLSYKERWTSPQPARALDIGSLTHAVLEAHYRREVAERTGAAGQTLIDSQLSPEGILADAEARGNEHAELVRWIYSGYVERWGEREAEWRVMGVETKVEERLRNRAGNKTQFVLKGRIDLLVKWNGGWWVVDHKTTSRMPREKSYDLEDQFGIYVWLLRQSGLDVRGVIHNAINTKQLVREQSLEERFKRTLTVRTDAEMQTMAFEALDHFRQAYAPRRATKAGVGALNGASPRRPKGVAGGPEMPPRSPDGDRCTWRCSYLEPCLMSRKGQAIQPLLEDLGYSQNFTRH